MSGVLGIIFMDKKLKNIESPTIKRTILLDCFMTKNISLDTQYRIALLINQSSNREQKAEEMIRIVESAKSEMEILAMIKTME